MGTFRYLGDRLFLVCGLAYVLNRWWIAPVSGSAFLTGYFDDLLLIPCGLPVFLWLQRKLGLRKHDGMPGGREVLLHLVIWAAIAEGVAPFLFSHLVGDPWDVLAYGCGAMTAYLWWKAVPVARPSFA